MELLLGRYKATPTNLGHNKLKQVGLVLSPPTTPMFFRFLETLIQAALLPGKYLKNNFKF